MSEKWCCPLFPKPHLQSVLASLEHGICPYVVASTGTKLLQFLQGEGRRLLVAVPISAHAAASVASAGPLSCLGKIADPAVSVFFSSLCGFMEHQATRAMFVMGDWRLRQLLGTDIKIFSF